MRTWDVFFPDVLPEVLGCPEPTVERALIHTARDFFAFTKAWREDLDAIVLATDIDTYEMECPLQSEVVQLREATINGRAISIYTSTDSTLEDRLSTNRGRGIQTADGINVRVFPTPAADGAELVINAVLQPTDTATSLPNEMADRYKLELATGALARLLAMNKAEWANPTLSGVKDAQYIKHRGRVQKAAWRGFSSSTPRSVGQYF